MSAEFEAVIGLEVHCQLATDSKIFCSCPARPPGGVSVSELPPNANTCPVCAGHPGALPVLNRKAVDHALRAGLALGCQINRTHVFARKNYFYPDLPKGYQISQYDRPLCEDGRLAIQAGDQSREIRIQRIHMEEDAGKSVHSAQSTAVNLNRAGVPLIEIVSHPDLRTAEEAGTYLRALHGIVTWLGISDGNMQEGNFRCDANVSVRPKGSPVLGTRAEVKNVNSFRFVEKAIEHEISRQTAILRSGGKVLQETRGYDPDRDVTVSLRSKEEAQDYRYFPEPDLLPVELSEAWIEEVRRALPELPAQRRARYVAELGLSPYDAGVLTSSAGLVEFFERTVALGASAKPVANFLTGEVARRLNDEGIEIGQSRLTPTHLAELVMLVQAGQVSSTGAKQALGVAWQTGHAMATIVDREGLRQVSDLGELERWVDEVWAANPGQAAELRSGKDKLLGFFTGQVMKKSGGKANPALIQELIRKKVTS